MHCQVMNEKGKYERNDKSIDALVFESNRKTQRSRVNGLISHLHALKTLLRQGVAIRGSDDSVSNIFQFNLDKAGTDYDFKEFTKSK